MKILIDAMGGDKAPLEMIKGAAMARDEFSSDSVTIVLVGKKSLIDEVAKKNSIDTTGIDIINAEEFIAMDEPPLSVRTKPDTSLKIGFEKLSAGLADAMVSAGSTGALHTGATLFVHRLPGVRRAAIGTVLPFKNPTLLIDSGANTVLSVEHFIQFAAMGNIYMKEIFDVENPRIGLLNIGTEKNKGTKLQEEAYEALSQMRGINFVGNVEGNAAAFGACDVLLSDGFTGNIFLKGTEGVGKFILGSLKSVFTKNLRTKIAYLVLKNEISEMKKSFDSSEYGGAPLLGVCHPVIKAHGNADAKTIKNAVRVAIKCAKCDIGDKISNECLKYAVPGKTEEEVK